MSAGLLDVLQHEVVVHDRQIGICLARSCDHGLYTDGFDLYHLGTHGMPNIWAEHLDGCMSLGPSYALDRPCEDVGHMQENPFLLLVIVVVVC